MEDRQTMAIWQRFDQYIEEFTAAEVAKSQEKKGDEESFEEILQEIKTHPAFMKDVDYTKPQSKEVEGLMRIKYEQEDPTSIAEAFNKDGCVECKKERYDKAIDNWTAGIKIKCPNKVLNATLYSNRATAQFYKQNYRSALQDAIIACKFKPDHISAVIRGAKCCMEMKKYAEASLWSDFGLLTIDKENLDFDRRRDLREIKQKAEVLMAAGPNWVDQELNVNKYHLKSNFNHLIPMQGSFIEKQASQNREDKPKKQPSTVKKTKKD